MISLTQISDKCIYVTVKVYGKGRNVCNVIATNRQFENAPERKIRARSRRGKKKFSAIAVKSVIRLRAPSDVPRSNNGSYY